MTTKTLIALIVGVVLLAAAAFFSYRYGYGKGVASVPRPATPIIETVAPDTITLPAKTRFIYRDVPNDSAADHWYAEAEYWKREAYSAMTNLATYMETWHEADTTRDITIYVMDERDSVVAASVMRSAMRLRFKMPPDPEFAYTAEPSAFGVRVKWDSRPCAPEETTWIEDVWSGFRTGSAFLVAGAFVYFIYQLFAGA